MLQVVRGIDGFTGDEPGFRAWVFTIAHRRLQDAHRRRARRPIETADDGRLEAALPPASTSTEPEALAAVSTEQVVALVGRLTDDQREVLLLRLVAGLTTGEVAEVTGRTPEAVKGLSKRGLARLRELTGLGGSTAASPPAADRADPQVAGPAGSSPTSGPPAGAGRARTRGGSTPTGGAAGLSPPDGEVGR